MTTETVSSAAATVPIPLLANTAHRPWPLPAAPWVMAQTWRDLLFAHWPLPAAALQALLPPALTVDAFDGQGWLGIVPFKMQGVRPRGLPAVPWLSAFPELNVRTYVQLRDRGIEKRGVYFFSLDAANPVAVQIARRTFWLSYFDAHGCVPTTTAARCITPAAASIAARRRRIWQRATCRPAPCTRRSPAISTTG
jgi:uncharacterized protein YqjF (DUF2071 family)